MEFVERLGLIPGGSDRSAKVLKARSESFVKLAGDPTKGSEGGKMCHALRSELEGRFPVVRADRKQRARVPAA
mgnify:CR=1 FL=1